MYRIEKNTNRSYPIVFTDTFQNLKEEIEQLVIPSQILIVTDSHVAPFYLEEIVLNLQSIATTFSHVFEAGEKSKQLTTVTEVYETLIAHQMDRNALIVALGGGVVGDLAGFVASSYMRGIPFIQVPTTVLAQNDSSMGGKVGIDYLKHKNMVGAFHQPLLVYNNVSALKTLPEREYKSGMGEVIKHALIKDIQLYNFLKENHEVLAKQVLEVVLEMTYRSAKVKCDIIEKDPFERGCRKWLNFGHTIGHAIETLSDFSMLHGECVAYGMCMSAHISCKRGFISALQEEEIINLCKRYGLLTVLESYPIEAICKQMGYDKKKAYGKISFILLKGIAAAFIAQDVTDEEIGDAVQFVEKTCQ